jgi:hypothetical protein
MWRSRVLEPQASLEDLRVLVQHFSPRRDGKNQDGGYCFLARDGQDETFALISCYLLDHGN